MQRQIGEEGRIVLVEQGFHGKCTDVQQCVRLGWPRALILCPNEYTNEAT